MKFNINTNTLREALESAQVKGKYVKRSGLSSGSLEECVYLKAQDNVLEIWSGNSTFIVNLTLELEIEENGYYIGKSADIIAYLKKFGENVTLHKTEHLTMTSGTKKASLPRIIEWPSMDAITRMGPKMMDVPTAPSEELPKVSNINFEAMVTISNESLSEAISMCELVGSGVYRFDVNDDGLKISSSDGVTNNFSDVVTPFLKIGDDATVEFSSPIHKFFKKDQMLNIYLLDDAPVFIVANDRRMIKAPYIAGV